MTHLTAARRDHWFASVDQRYLKRLFTRSARARPASPSSRFHAHHRPHHSNDDDVDEDAEEEEDEGLLDAAELDARDRLLAYRAQEGRRTFRLRGDAPDDDAARPASCPEPRVGDAVRDSWTAHLGRARHLGVLVERQMASEPVPIPGPATVPVSPIPSPDLL